MWFFFMGIPERESVPKEARKCSAAQGSHSEVVPCAFWRLVSKSWDECKGLFARGCEAKRWPPFWTCYSLGTILQPIRINSVPDVKCFCNNKNVLYVQSMVWHFVCHPVEYISFVQTVQTTLHSPLHLPKLHPAVQSIWDSPLYHCMCL